MPRPRSPRELFASHSPFECLFFARTGSSPRRSLDDGMGIPRGSMSAAAWDALGTRLLRARSTPMARVIPTEPLWMTVPLPEFPALDRDLDVDVLIVGAGVTGITAAYLLCQEGVKVALIEREKVAS